MELKREKYFLGDSSHFLLFLLLILMVSCGDIVPGSEPKVVSSSPSAEEDTDFPLNRGLSITFNKIIDPETLSERAFFIREAGQTTALAGTITTDGVTASLKPETNLKFSTPYMLTVTQDVRDLSGRPLSEVFQVAFTTLAAPELPLPGSEPNPDAGLDKDPPRILSISPLNGESDVLLTRLITVIFNEGIAPESLRPETFFLSRGARAKKIFLSGQMAIFEPESALRPDEHYTVTLTTGIKDLAGNALVSDFIWTFSTQDEEDHEDNFD